MPAPCAARPEPQCPRRAQSGRSRCVRSACRPAGAAVPATCAVRPEPRCRSPEARTRTDGPAVEARGPTPAGARRDARPGASRRRRGRRTRGGARGAAAAAFSRAGGGARLLRGPPRRSARPGTPSVGWEGGRGVEAQGTGGRLQPDWGFWAAHRGLGPAAARRDALPGPGHLSRVGSRGRCFQSGRVVRVAHHGPDPLGPAAALGPVRWRLLRAGREVEASRRRARVAAFSRTGGSGRCIAAWVLRRPAGTLCQAGGAFRGPGAGAVAFSRTGGSGRCIAAWVAFSRAGWSGWHIRARTLRGPPGRSARPGDLPRAGREDGASRRRARGAAFSRAGGRGESRHAAPPSRVCGRGPRPPGREPHRWAPASRRTGGPTPATAARRSPSSRPPRGSRRPAPRPPRPAAR